jgi:shikimate dehydrogenase
MKGKLENESHFSAGELSGIKFVYDLVTSVTDTPLIREAKAAGIPAIGGMEMLVAQAEMQFEIWTGTRPEAGLMKNSLVEKLRN